MWERRLIKKIIWHKKLTSTGIRKYFVLSLRPARFECLARNPCTCANAHVCVVLEIWKRWFFCCWQKQEPIYLNHFLSNLEKTKHLFPNLLHKEVVHGEAIRSEGTILSLKLNRNIKSQTQQWQQANCVTSEIKDNEKMTLVWSID